MRAFAYTIKREAAAERSMYPRHCSNCRREPLRVWLRVQATPAAWRKWQATALGVPPEAPHFVICLPCGKRIGKAAQ